MHFFMWLEHTAIANAIRSSIWMYPALETGHYIGLSLLVGSIMLIDLRLLGVAKGLPLRSMLGLLPFVWAGFLINVTTGSLIFIYGATSFGANKAFQLKMVLLVLAGINAMLFTIAAARSGKEWVSIGRVPIAVRIIATLSLLFWIGVVTAGRWMAYV
jgi:hypothetical protein